MTPRQKGFTLIELIITISIMVVLSTIVLANFRNGQKQRSVQLAEESVVAALREAQTYAQSGKKTTDNNTGCQTPQNYYVDFTYSSQYTIFALNNCGTTDSIEVFKLPVNVRFKANQIKVDSTIVANDLKVYYTPPFAKTTAGLDAGSAASYAHATMTVESTDGTYNRTATADGISGNIQ